MSTTLGKDFQPRVKSAANVLVGVAQVRMGLPSARNATAKAGVVQVVSQSDLKTIDLPSGGTCDIVVPNGTAATETLSGILATSGSYTGAYDGAFLVRYNGSGWDIFGPDGVKDANVDFNTSAYEMQVDGAGSGLSVSDTADALTNMVEGETLIVPVWASAARSAIQTGIACPYSLFKGSNESVGGLTSASFTPKVDDVKKLTSGFPESVDDSIIAKTSVSVSFESQEFGNTQVENLRDMMNRIINEAQSPAVAVEVVCRTRGNSLITYWIPNATLENLPSIAPQNDFSTLAWELASATQTEQDGATETYNAWLTNTKLYTELSYIH